jgi:hypothetical protein
VHALIPRHSQRRTSRRCDSDDRQTLDRRCHHITRAGQDNERVQTNASGQVEAKLKTAWRDGTMHLAMLPPEFQASGEASPSKPWPGEPNLGQRESF